jgi:hypothetical protein
MPQITRADAKTFIARPVSHTPNANELVRAQEALEDAIELWNVRHDWNYLLMDTSNSFSVASCTIAGDGVTVTSSASLQPVNIGVTVSGTGVTVGTTITGRSQPTSGGAVTLTLSAAATPGTVTLTFTGGIPIRAGVDTYYMPSPFKRHISARLTTNPRTLEFKHQQEIDKMFAKQNDQGPPAYYNVFDPRSFSQANVAIARVYPIPDSADTAVFRFYRPIAIPTGENDLLDLHDRYVRPVLWLARYFFLLAEEGETARTQKYERLGEESLRWAMADDDPQSADAEVRLISQMEYDPRRYRSSHDITGEF